MNKSIARIAAATALLLAGFGTAHAQTVVLDCPTDGACFVESEGIAYDTITWYIDKRSTDAIFPRNCTNSSSCEFICRRRPGIVAATVNLVSNSQVVASASSLAQCSGIIE